MRCNRDSFCLNKYPSEAPQLKGNGVQPAAMQESSMGCGPCSVHGFGLLTSICIPAVFQQPHAQLALSCCQARLTALSCVLSALIPQSSLTWMHLSGVPLVLNQKKKKRGVGWSTLSQSPMVLILQTGDYMCFFIFADL